MSSLLLATLATSIGATPPVGRWEGELTGGAPSGHLGNPGHNVPLLGNGYLGLVLQSSPDGVGSHGYNFNGSTLELFLNTNANWDCEKSSAVDAMPPAVCSMRGLGGLTVNLKNDTAAGLMLSGANHTKFAVEQRLQNGSLWTERRAGGSFFRTETIVHPDENALLTTLTFAGSTAVEVELQLWVLGRTSHVRPCANSSCRITSAGIATCSRRYNPPNTTGFVSPWTALANRVVGKGNLLLQREVLDEVCVNRFECVSTATSVYRIRPGQMLQLVTTASDNLLQGNAHDPSTDAAALAQETVPTALIDASCSFWRDYWNASAVLLPSRPALERMWYGAQYATVGAAASPVAVGRMRGKLPPPGLYGPFATGDFAFWNGDFTLDYNQEANFYHVFSSNHPERAASAFAPIIDYMPSARAQAKRVALAAKLGTECDPKALNYPCHLAPWGQQSRDTRTYMEWNGPYAALLFINSWEYTRDVGFAKNTTLPLLEGLNAWSHCYLQRSGTSLTLQDWNAVVPDQIFENGPAKNPSVGLALMMRVASAHRDIARAVGVVYPAYVDDIIEHLAPLPVVSGPPGSSKKVWAAATGRDWYNSSIFSIHFPSVLFPIFPAELVDFSVPREEAAVARASAELYANFSCDDSGPSGYPEQPFETCVDAGWGALTVFSALARTLSITKTKSGGNSNDPQRLLDGPTAQVTPRVLADQFEKYIVAYGANSSNLLAYAPGGGVENIGLSQALNDMLLQSTVDGVIHLFPAWPVDEPASFTTLRTKGAFLVSASWLPSQGTAHGVSITATVDSPRVRMASPFTHTVQSVRLQCSRLTPSPRGKLIAVDKQGHLTWSMAAGQSCELVPQ